MTTAAHARKTEGRRGGRAAVPLFVAVSVALFAVATPVMVLLAIAMAPTFVAFMIDRRPAKHATIAVGSLNFAGAAPLAFEMFGSTATIEGALVVLADVFTLGIVFGAAATGWALVFCLPPMAGAYLALTSERRGNNLRRLQRKLVDEWGEDVTGKTTGEAEAAE